MALWHAAVLWVCGVSGELCEWGAADGSALWSRLPPAVHCGVVGSRKTLLPSVSLAQLQEETAASCTEQPYWKYTTGLMNRFNRALLSLFTGLIVLSSQLAWGEVGTGEELRRKRCDHGCCCHAPSISLFPFLLKAMCWSPWQTDDTMKAQSPWFLSAEDSDLHSNCRCSHSKLCSAIKIYF